MTVSYTHLDVYKRQNLSQTQRITLHMQGSNLLSNDNFQGQVLLLHLGRKKAMNVLQDHPDRKIDGVQGQSVSFDLGNIGYPDFPVDGAC